MGAKRQAKKEFAKEQELAKLRAKAARKGPSPSQYTLSPTAKRRNEAALSRRRHDELRAIGERTRARQAERTYAPADDAAPPPCPECGFATDFPGVMASHRASKHGAPHPTTARDARIAQQARRKATGTPDWARRIGWGFVALVALGWVAAALYSTTEDSADTPDVEAATDESSTDDAGSDVPDDDVQRVSAFEVCKDFVKDRLRSPGTASFRNYFEDDGEVQVTGSGRGPFTISSTVDSENGFGAELRTPFVCQVRDVGDDEWRLLDLQLIE